jgi:hypothetical protein
MGGIRSFRIEYKRFDLSKEGDGIDSVSLFESGRYMRHSVSMGKKGARWLGKCIEENIARETEQAFIRTFRESDKGYVIQRFNNKHGRYLEITEYGQGGCKGRLAIPEGQSQSGWRGFNKELTLLMHPILIEERSSHPRQGYMKPTDDKTQTRIPAKERLGPAASYADALRVPATQHKVAKGKALTSHNQISKDLKMSEVTQVEEGKANLPEKFLGAHPYRRLGTVTAIPKLRITLNADGKRTVTWDRQKNEVKLAGEGLHKNLLGQAAKKPTTLTRVEPEDIFSGPSSFEWGESSTNGNKPKQIWVPKIKGSSGGPIKKTCDVVEDVVDTSGATNDAVEDSVSSRDPALDLAHSAPGFSQDFTCLMLRTAREGEFRRIRVGYYVGINISISRNITEYWGEWRREAFPTLLLGNSNMEWADDVEEAESEPSFESLSLAVVACDNFREGSTEESTLDIAPLNS